MIASTTATASTPVKSSESFFNAAEQKEMFLKLLVAQLQNQDPTAPMDQKDMMNQMATFSSVEQMSNMSKTLESMQQSQTFNQGVALIGKQVDFVLPDSDVTETGLVTAVSYAGGVAKLVTDTGKQINVSDVVMVR